MVFASAEFLFLFLPAFLLSQAIFPYKNLQIVLYSVLFYFIGEGWFTGIVFFSLGMNYLFGLLLESSDDDALRKIYLAIAIATNLLLLISFKYTSFIVDNIFPSASQQFKDIHLPLGISFYTFHALSYVVDIYRRQARAERSFTNLAVYILMFPQLIAGPILRYASIAPQLESRIVSSKHVYFGVMFFVVGLGQKVLIADTMAGIADPLFAQWRELSASASWLAVASYTFQIYFDFGGYSNMAIGLAMLIGFYFPLNFNCPYVAKSVTDFWRRWHISLSSWFRDYLYIPLGGNKYGSLRTYRNLFVVFALCGLWHGAAWTFVLWGLYHGMLLIIERLGLERALQAAPSLLAHAYALLAVMIGWVLFRAESLEQAFGILGKMFLLHPGGSVSPVSIMNGEGLVTLGLAAVFSTPVVYDLTKSLVAWHTQPQWPSYPPSAYALGLICAIAIFALAAMKILAGSYSPFIYFRF